MSLKNVQNALCGTELESQLIECKESSATVELAAVALNTEPDRIAKTLSFLIEDKPILIAVSGHSKVDNKKYRDFFHIKAKMIPFDEVEKYIEPCGGCPFAVNSDVEIYLDKSLKKYDFVYTAAGSGNTAVKPCLFLIIHCQNPNMTTQQIFINNLKAYRKQAGFTQAQLASLIDKSFNYINGIECGVSFPSPDVIDKIAGVLKNKAGSTV